MPCWILQRMRSPILHDFLQNLGCEMRMGRVQWKAYSCIFTVVQQWAQFKHDFDDRSWRDSLPRDVETEAKTYFVEGPHAGGVSHHDHRNGNFGFHGLKKANKKFSQSANCCQFSRSQSHRKTWKGSVCVEGVGVEGGRFSRSQNLRNPKFQPKHVLFLL